MRYPKTLRQWLIPDRRPTARKPELLHFRREADGQYIRYHLRIDPAGPALLIAGASDALLLSQEGAVVAKAILSGESVDSIHERLKVSNPDELIAEVQNALAEFGHDRHRYPIFNLVDPSITGQRLSLVAPFQADVVVTDPSRIAPIIDRLWEAGIPHVRLLLHAWDELNRDRANRRAIVELATHAEDIGMIAGVRARAGQLASESFLLELAEAGLDYVVLPWGITKAFHSTLFGAEDYDQLRSVVDDVIRWEMTPVLSAAIFPSIEEDLPSALDFAQDWNIHNVEVFAVADATQSSLESTAQFYPPQSLRQVASWIEDVADHRLERLIWLPTVGRLADQTLDEAVRRGPRAAGDVSIRVLSDGSVIPPRGPYHIAGNLLTDSWQSIWRDAAFDNYRNRIEVPTHCDQCPIMAICAADCPAEISSWSTEDPS